MFNTFCALQIREENLLSPARVNVNEAFSRELPLAAAGKTSPALFTVSPTRFSCFSLSPSISAIISADSSLCFLLFCGGDLKLVGRISIITDPGEKKKRMF